MCIRDRYQRRVHGKIMEVKKKILVIFAHPEEKSFCSAIKNTAVNALTKAGHEVKITDLYKSGLTSPLDKSNFKTLTHPEYFKPETEQAECNKNNFEGYIPEIKEEHEKVKWCDMMLFVFPLWWWSVPGIMKNWIDKVLTPGFAYSTKGDYSLKPRKAMIMYTTGGPKAFHEEIGMDKVIWKLLHDGVFKFCGLTSLEPFIAYHVAWIGEDARKEYLAEVETIMSKIEERAEFKSQFSHQ
eukprot:TRINITY_DN15994_c0_g1_i6.p1 TRINITY_DN15994_c0_g1~~TRINITY_DN15994_c0_g1_i6.p1  ORF type:complete len:240 (+),score=48.66 TRINITY_DN15994_c0_g1_i6:178-897(+)